MISPTRAVSVSLLALTSTLLPLTPCSAGANVAPSGQAEDGSPPVSVSFMTYNVQGPGWNADRLAQVVAAIEAELPDVLSLHEAGSMGPFSAGVQLAAALSGDYDTFHTATAEPVYLRKGAALSVLDSGVHLVPLCPLVGGVADLPWLKLSTPEGALFDVYSAHYCVSFTPAGPGDPEGNGVQAVSTVLFIAGNTAPDTPYLILGDLNASQTSATIDFLVNGTPLLVEGQPVANPLAIDDTWALAPGQGGQTHPGTTAGGGQMALDWILAGPGVTVSAAEVISFVIPPGEQLGFSDHLPVTATLDFAVGDPWQDLGQALAGTLGAPSLVGAGSLVGGDTITLSLSGALPGALANLVLGFTPLNAPFKGGTLVPDPLLVIGLGTDGAGQLELSGTWPVGIGPGATIYFQHWIADLGGPVGFAASNAVVGTTP
jgi:endonuclease/exonuclease/phosphatase family metal-dependent hydrolase